MTAATGQPHYQEPYRPVPIGFKHVPFDDVEAVIAATTDRTAAVMLEPVQGEGGVNIASPGYLEGVREWCDEKGLLAHLRRGPDRAWPARHPVWLREIRR